MKRYSLIVALHIIGIAFLSVGVYLLVDAGLWFSALMAFLILLAIAVHLYRLQMMQVRMMRHLAESLRYDDMMLSFRSPYKNRSMEDMVDELSEASNAQVLINLIKNAKEACSRKEHPRIEVKMLPALSWQCLITVSDNGEGILPEVQDKIFVPFFTTKPSGSGIGLSLCKQVMNRHGGNITVQSTVGKGSCFTLLFG